MRRLLVPISTLLKIGTAVRCQGDPSYTSDGSGLEPSPHLDSPPLAPWPLGPPAASLAAQFSPRLVTPMRRFDSVAGYLALVCWDSRSPVAPRLSPTARPRARRQPGPALFSPVSRLSWTPAPWGRAHILLCSPNNAPPSEQLQARGTMLLGCVPDIDALPPGSRAPPRRLGPAPPPSTSLRR